jgi:chitin synthase
MARPYPQQNVSFNEAPPPSRRAARDESPTPPVRGYTAKSSSSLGKVTSNTPNAPVLGYDDGYVDAGGSNPQGFSSSNGADVRRKKSMVKPERERVDPGHRLWHYREHAAEDGLNVMPSCE